MRNSSLELSKRGEMQKASYEYCDIMNYAIKSYMNLKSLGEYKVDESQLGAKSNDQKFLALSAENTRLKDLLKAKGNGSSDNQSKNWRNERKGNETRIIRNNHVYYWCEKDCYERPQWCGRKKCLSKSEWKKKKDNEQDSDKSNKFSSKFKDDEDFNIALESLAVKKEKLQEFKEMFLN